MKKTLFGLIFLMVLSVNAFSVTWNEISASAVKYNNTLESARRTLYRAQSDARSSFSGVLPRVSVSGSSSKAGNDLSAFGASELSYKVGASASLLIFDWFNTPNRIIAACESANAAAHNFNAQSASVRYEVFSDYINVLKTKQLVSITEGIKDRRKIQTDQVKLRYDGGRENIGSVLSAQADYQKAVSEYEAAKRQYVFALAELTRGSGILLTSDPEVEGSLDNADIQMNTKDAKLIAEISPSYLSAVCRRKAQEASYHATLGSVMPDISMSASAGKSGNKWPPSNENWSLGISASYDLFDGGVNIAKVQSAGDTFESAKADEREALNTAMSLSESAINALLEAKDNAQVSEKTLQAAETRAMIADSQYSNGLMDYDTWTVIQDNLVNARKNNIQAKANLFITKAALDKAEGLVLDEPK